MSTKERLHQLVDELSELEANDALGVLVAHRQNRTSVHILEPNGNDEAAAAEDDAMLLGHEAAIERLRTDPEQWAAWHAEIAELDGTLGDGLTGL